LNSYSPLEQQFTVNVVPCTIADKVAHELTLQDGGLYDEAQYLNADLNLFLLEDIHLSPYDDSIVVLGATWNDIYEILEYLGFTYDTIHDQCDDCGRTLKITSHSFPAGPDNRDTGDVLRLLYPYRAAQASLASGHLCYRVPHGIDVLQVIKGY
jgi:hypothetical protein